MTSWFFPKNLAFILSLILRLLQIILNVSMVTTSNLTPDNNTLSEASHRYSLLFSNFSAIAVDHVSTWTIAVISQTPIRQKCCKNWKYIYKIKPTKKTPKPTQQQQQQQNWTRDVSFQVFMETINQELGNMFWSSVLGRLKVLVW